MKNLMIIFLSLSTSFLKNYLKFFLFGVGLRETLNPWRILPFLNMCVPEFKKKKMSIYRWSNPWHLPFVLTAVIFVRHQYGVSFFQFQTAISPAWDGASLSCQLCGRNTIYKFHLINNYRHTDKIEYLIKFHEFGKLWRHVLSTCSPVDRDSTEVVHLRSIKL